MAKHPDRTAKPKPKPVEIILDEAETDTLRPIGGSKSDRFNNTLIDAMVKTGWFPSGQSDEDRNRQLFVAVTGLRAFKAADEIEGMIAAQAMAAHHASMECSRRAMVPDQPFEARRCHWHSLAPAAARGYGAGNHAGSRRCQTAAVGCMAGAAQGLRQRRVWRKCGMRGRSMGGTAPR